MVKTLLLTTTNIVFLWKFRKIHHQKAYIITLETLMYGVGNCPKAVLLHYIGLSRIQKLKIELTKRSTKGCLPWINSNTYQSNRDQANSSAEAKHLCPISEVTQFINTNFRCSRCIHPHCQLTTHPPHPTKKIKPYGSAILLQIHHLFLWLIQIVPVELKANSTIAKANLINNAITNYPEQTAWLHNGPVFYHYFLWVWNASHD